MIPPSSSQCRLFGALLFGVLAAGLLATPAAAAPTEVNSCQTISSAGIYELTADITNSDAPACLSVTASDVVIHGNGHVVEGTDSLQTTGIDVSAGATDVLVTNLRLTDWGKNAYVAGDDVTIRDSELVGAENHGLTVDGATGVTLSGTTLTDTVTGVYVTGGGTEIRVENVRVSDTSNLPTVTYGVYVSNGEVTVVDTTISGAGTAGVELASGDVRVLDSAVTDGSGPGVLLEDAGGVVRGSRLAGNAGPGVEVSADGAVVTGTTAADNEIGIRTVAEGGEIADVAVERTVVRDNAKAGINLTGVDGADLTSVYASGNADGVVVRSSTNVALEGGDLSDNAGIGLSLAATDGASIRDLNVIGNARGVNLSSAPGTAFENVTFADSAEWSLYASGDSDGLSGTDVALPTATVAFSAAEDVALKPAAVPNGQPTDKGDVGRALNVTGTEADGTTFLGATYNESFVNLTVSYPESAVDRINESSLAVFAHDEDSWQQPAGYAAVDTEANEVTANVTFETFGSSVTDPTPDRANVYAPLGNLTDNDGDDGSGDGDDGGDDGSGGGDDGAGESGGGAGGGGGGDGGASGSANVSVVSATVNRTEVLVGQPVEVTAVLRNDGSASGELTVRLSVDGEFAGESRVERIPAGETERVSVVYTFGSAGSYEVAMNDVVASTVRARPKEPTATPTPTDSGGTATPTPVDGTDGPVASPTDADDGGTEIGGVGLAIGGIAGLVALGGAAYYLVAVKGVL